MSIQRYLEQLIEEIDEKMKIPSPASIRKNDGRNFFFEQDEIDEFMEHRGIPVGHYSKILKESLPPPDRLNLEQAGMLVSKISGLLEKWNFHLDYPESTPIKEKYRLIYEGWDEFEVPTSGWHFHQDFCTGSCEECEVKTWCETYNTFENKDDNIDEDWEPIPLDMDYSSNKKPAKISPGDSSSKKEKITTILNSIQEKGFIASVHNYCDRWCDKCSLKAKCSIFYFEKELLKIAADDNSGRSSLESVKHVYTLTNDVLEENLKDDGIDLNLPLETNDDIFPKIPPKEQKVLDFAKEYAFSVPKVLDSIPEEKIIEKMELVDAVNVIIYYHIFISAKLARAFFGRISYPEDDPLQNDSNGSAKIALIAIKKSMVAWAVILKSKITDEEVILNQCVKLKKLQKMAKKFFPDAEKFLRPGFDFMPD